MSSSDDTIAALRAALKVSPDNLPLRKHLAQTLMQLGQYGEAEAEFLSALRVAPRDSDIKLALANLYYQNNKTSQALVIVEDLVGDDDPPGASHVLYARILFQQGEVANAVAQYKLGLERDADAGDEELADRLGIASDEFQEIQEVNEGRLREPVGGEATGFQSEVEQPKTSFADVGGMDALKEEIRLKIIYPLQHPEMYAAYGKQVGGGILLYGPPGCGKTHMARATAGEIKAAFLSVGISDVLDMWIGSSERNLKQVFDDARTHRPCVLFFDEVDALGARRSDMRTSAGRQLINQFLSEMDGIDSSNEGLLILAATNAPWHIDPAFRRPGRFDRVLFVPPPDETARADILRILCEGKPLDNVDFSYLASKTSDYSGADLKAVLDVAVERKLQEAMKQGVPKPLTTKDFVAGIKALRPTTREWFSTARNYALYSNEGGAYDDVVKYLKLK